MSTDPGVEPITDDEIVYRRVSENSGWYNPESNRPVAWEAFRPNNNDINGLSVWRAKYLSAREAAVEGSRPNRRYYVLKLAAGRLRQHGIQVKPSAHEGRAGHASLSNMDTATYTESKDAVRELAEKIAEHLVEQVIGPFES